MADRKKILFIPRWYPDRYDNMYGLFIQKHALTLKNEFDVSVLYISSDPFLEPGKVEKSEEDFHGIREFRIYYGKRKNPVANAFEYAKNAMEGLRWVIHKTGLPDISHVHVLSRTAFPALWLKYTKGIPYLITEHWSRYLPVNISKGAYSGFLRKLFTRFAVKNAFAVTTVTKNLANAMQQLGLKNEYFVIPNVADINDFRPEENKSPGLVKKFVHVSCFDEPAKNIKGIINVFQKIASQRSDFLLEIIGDGKDFKMIKEYAQNTGLMNERIFFTGLLTGDILSDKMRHADAFVMFSNYENLPCTIVESLCCGVPVISSDVGGINEHISADSGILVPPGDETGLAEAVNVVLNNSRSFDQEKIRRYALEHFSMEIIKEKFKRVYERSGKI